jgi:hypothetical protein
MNGVIGEFISVYFKSWNLAMVEVYGLNYPTVEVILSKLVDRCVFVTMLCRYDQFADGNRPYSSTT